MDLSEGDKQKLGVRWHAVDEEALYVGRPPVTKKPSSSQLSINSAQSRRGSVDPGTILPIQYRTVSFDLDDPKENGLADATRAKDVVATEQELSGLEWHLIPPQEVFSRLSTSLNNGLSEEVVKARLVEYGKNMHPPPPTHRFQQIFGYFFKGFGSILFIGSILVFICWKPLGQPPTQANLALAIVLLLVFLSQGAFNAWQFWSSSKVMASIKNMMPEDCLLIRDGNQVTIAASDIVPGDVITIKAGDKLPADVRFVDISSDASYDRSVLTGESLPLSGTVDSTDDNYLETKCIGLQGTHCVSGTAMAVVVSTGAETVFARIAKLTNEPKTGMTTLEKEILYFVLLIVSGMVITMVLIIILWAVWLRKDHPEWISVPTLIVDIVSVAIAFMPVGLPLALTASLTIMANLMRQNKVLCKSLKTVETLGAVSVICSDKTGTLTKNEMSVTECSIGTKTMIPESAREEMKKICYDQNQNTTTTAVDQLRAIAGLCNSGEFDAATNNLPLEERKINGDATDKAILRFSEGLGSVSELKGYWKKTFELAFNSKNKFMIRTFSLTDSEGLKYTLPLNGESQFNSEDILLTIKGAPDVLIDRCTHFTSSSGDTVVLNSSIRSMIEGIKNDWSAHGKRVILLARKILPAPQPKMSNDLESRILESAKTDLTLVGLVSIVDPPRAEVPAVVQTLRGAGIRVFMVTGDFALTAQAIATDCGIITNPPSLVENFRALSRDTDSQFESDKKAFSPVVTRESASKTSIVISGPEMIGLDETQWNQLCQYDEIVFARTTPEQKLRIVREFQARDAIVGMTGDGVNDAPSLKAADIGIALGSGSDIAIEAADMVLLESFSAIVEAVQYGRVVFDNLKKTIAYLLPAGSFSELWPIVTNVLFGMPQILSSFLMIVICCFTDCAAATVLTYEKPEADVLLRKPRNSKTDRLVDWRLVLQAYGFVGMLETFTSFVMSYWYLQRNGLPFSAFWFKYGVVPNGMTQEYYNQKLAEASSIYFVNVVVMQWFSLMSLRTRRLSIFQHPPAFNKQTQNLLLFPSILFAFIMVIVWLYIPQLQVILSTSKVPAEHFFLAAAFGMAVLLIDEGRKYVVRGYPKSILAKLAW